MFSKLLPFGGWVRLCSTYNLCYNILASLSGRILNPFLNPNNNLERYPKAFSLACLATPPWDVPERGITQPKKTLLDTVSLHSKGLVLRCLPLLMIVHLLLLAPHPYLLPPHLHSHSFPLLLVLQEARGLNMHINL